MEGTTREERAELLEAMLKTLRGRIPRMWTEKQLATFFLACGAAMADVSRSMTRAEVIKFVAQLPDAGDETAKKS